MNDRDGNLIVEAYSCGCYTLISQDAVLSTHCPNFMNRMALCDFRFKHKL